MISDIDIYRAANLLIMKYGRHAPNHADIWTDAMLEAGTLDGEVDLGATERARLQTPLRRDEKPWLVQRELQRIVELDT